MQKKKESREKRESVRVRGLLLRGIEVEEEERGNR